MLHQFKDKHCGRVETKEAYFDMVAPDVKLARESCEVHSSLSIVHSWARIDNWKPTKGDIPLNSELPSLVSDLAAKALPTDPVEPIDGTPAPLTHDGDEKMGSGRANGGRGARCLVEEWMSKDLSFKSRRCWSVPRVLIFHPSKHQTEPLFLTVEFFSLDGLDAKDADQEALTALFNKLTKGRFVDTCERGQEPVASEEETEGKCCRACLDEGPHGEGVPLAVT